MITRNWLDLSRKLVDRFDMNDSFTAVSQALGEYAQAWFGEGVLASTIYPNPFPFTMSGSVLGGTVGNGLAFDINGQLTAITAGSSTPKTFVLAPADTVHQRFDLVCLKYVSTGDTLVPKPSDPLTNVFLNLHDDFALVVVEGTPSASPVYPAKGNPLYIVLAGIKVPANATLGTQCTVDFSQREIAMASIVGAPVFRQETPSGTVNGTNNIFNITQQPLNPQSLLVMVDDLVLTNAEFSTTGTQINFLTPPALGQSVYAYYIANSSTGQNPLSGAQEVPSGTVDGVNALFTLSQNAVNQSSVMVFVDGVVSEVTEWALIQASNMSSIQFQPGSIPAPGQSVYVWYLINAASFGAIARSLTPETDYFTLSPTDISNGFVTLGHAPVSAAATVCDIVGNTSQVYGTDFTVSGMQLNWSGLGMQSVLFSGSILRVSYLY